MLKPSHQILFFFFSLVRDSVCMSQVIRNITLPTITLAVAVAMGTADWDCMIVWAGHFAWAHEASSWFMRGNSCAVTQQLSVSGRDRVDVRLLCETCDRFGSFVVTCRSDNTASVPHQRLVLFIWREAVVSCPGFLKVAACVCTRFQSELVSECVHSVKR